MFNSKGGGSYMRPKLTAGKSIFISVSLASLFLLGEIVIFNRINVVWMVAVLTVATLYGLLNSRIIDIYDKYAWVDDLTGLYNHKFFWTKLRKDGNQCMSLVMVDIDHFKKYNDIHGHLKGNHMLSHLGKILKEHFSEYGYACRFGGEEFIVILPSVDNETAYKMALELKDKINTYEPYEMNTVSIGISSADVTEVSPDALFKKVDNAMYEAKIKRNDVVNGGEYYYAP